MAFLKLGSTLQILQPNQGLYKTASKELDNVVAEKNDNFTYFQTIALHSDVPNLNGDIFPLDELKKSYKSFIGRGLYLDHNAQSVANAVGKVFDAKLIELPGATDEEGKYGVVCLCGVDKTTHPDIAKKVASGVIDSVSMGASVGSCTCGICGVTCSTPEEFCIHLQHQGQLDPDPGQKCTSIKHDVSFTELSLVCVPADPYAKMQQVFADFVGGMTKVAGEPKQFLEKFSFSIPCGNEKLCEMIYNLLDGYKKQGIMDLSADGSILKLSVEAKSEAEALKKLESLSQEQRLDVEKPLQKEEKSMSEEIKPVEEQVEKKDEAFSQDVIQKCKELDEQYDDQENYVMFEIVDNNIKDYYKVPSELIYDQVSKPNMYIYLDGKLLTVKEYLEVYEGPVDDIKSESAKEENIEKKAGIVPTEDVTLDNGTTYTVRYNPNEQSILSVMQDGKEVGIDGGTRLQILRKLFHKDEPTIVEENIEKKAEVQSNIEKNEVKQPLNHTARLMHIHKIKAGYSNNPDYYGDWFGDGQIDFSKVIDAEAPGDIYMVKIWGGSGYVLDVYLVKANDYEEAIDKVFEWSYNNEGKNNIIFDWEYLAKDCHEDYETDGFLGEGKPSDTMDYEEFEERWMEDMVSNSAYSLFARAENFFVDKVPTEYLPKEQNKSDLQEVESSKTQSNEVKEVKAEENKETKKEDLVPGVSKEDTKKAIEHDLAKEKEEAKGGEDETKDIETLEKAIKETDKGALSKVIDLLKKFIGGEAKEGEDLKDYKSDDLVKKLEEKPADKKASIEEPVNNVVNTVAEPVMDHIEAKPEVPAQPVPEVKEEVEEKKEEVKPSKDVKTKEDAVKVLEDVLKAGEEADVKELGKVLDFLKSDKKEEKKEEVKEEKVEEKAEPKKEDPVKEEKKEEVKEEAKPLFANVTRVSLLKTANLIDSKWVFHFKGTDKVACLSVKNLLPGVSEKVAYLTSKEFYNEMMDTLTKKQAFDGEAVKQIVANYNEKIKVGSDEAKSQVSKATSKAKNETDGKKVSDTSKAVDTKLTDDGKAQKQDKVNSKEDAGAIESATKKAPAETDIKVSAELEAKCKQLTAALEAKEAEVSQMKMQQELAAKTAKARQIVEKSIKCGLVQCNETFRQEELLKQASPLKAKEEAMKRTADSMVADLLALSDEELDKQASYLSNFKVEAEVKQLKPIKIEASCEQSEDEDLIKALGAEMW